MMSLPHLTYDEYKGLGGTLEEDEFKTSYLTAALGSTTTAAQTKPKRKTKATQ